MAVLLVLCVGAVSAADNADMANGVVLNDGDNDTNITIEVPDSVDVNVDKDVKFDIDILKDNESINFTKEDLTLNLTYNTTESIIIENYTLDKNVISFKVPVDFESAILNVLYKLNNETSVDSNITLNPVAKIIVTDIIQLDENKDVEFEINLLDIFGNNVTFTKEDIILDLYYFIDENNTLNKSNIDFNLSLKNLTKTVNGTNITYEALVISFHIPEEEGNFTHALIGITYKNGTDDEVNVNKTISFMEIKVLKNESVLEYQNNYLVIQLVNNYLNKSVVANKTVTFKGDNVVIPGFIVSKQLVTDNEGKAKLCLDELYSGGDNIIGSGTYYIPVNTTYVVTVYVDNVVGKQCSCKINAPDAVFSAPNYSSTYGSGAKWTVTLKNKKSGTTIKDLATIKLYSNKKCTSKYLIGTFSVYSGNGVGMNLAPGTYYVKVYATGSNYKAATITKTIVIKKVTAKISAKATTAYYKGNNTFKVRMVNKSNGKALVGASVLLNIYTGKKFKAVQLTTNDKGYAYWTVSGISIAKHKVLVGSNAVPSNIVTTYINYKKAPTTVSAPKVTNKCGLNQYLTIKVTRNVDKAALSGLALTVKVYNSKNKLVKTFSAKTDKTGVAKINTKTLAAGTYKVVISSSNKYYAVSKTVKSGIVMQKQKTVVTAPSVTNICGKKSYFKINVAKADGGKVISGLALTAKVYNSKGKLVKSYSLKTDSKGNAYVNTKDLAKGTYKVTISSSNKYYAVSKSVSNAIVMTKYSTKVVADNITAKYKKNGYFKVNITNVEDKPINGLSVVVKVYKKSKLVKTYTTTTNANGIATINTKALAKGTYKVAISTKNVSYAVSKTINNAIKII